MCMLKSEKGDSGRFGKFADQLARLAVGSIEPMIFT